jgi:hypothetical protein
LEKDFYFGTLGSFDCGFTQQLNEKQKTYKRKGIIPFPWYDFVFMNISKNLAQ